MGYLAVPNHISLKLFSAGSCFIDVDTIVHWHPADILKQLAPLGVVAVRMNAFGDFVSIIMIIDHCSVN